MEEIWKDIDSCFNYQVSNLGIVKSFKKWNDGLHERILKPEKDKDGYFKVVFMLNKKRKMFPVHRLVLMTFKPISNPELFQCNHIDGNKQNNCIDNLEWCTSSENRKHAFKIGLQKALKGKENGMYIKGHTQEAKDKISIAMKGEKNYNCKLTLDKVYEIRKLIKEGVFHKDIAKMFNIGMSQISRIKLNKSWKE